MSRLFAFAVAAVTTIAGLGSLSLFILFLAAEGLDLVDFRMGPLVALAWDALLCLVFFAQHSGMVRRPFRDLVSRVLPVPYYGAVYTVASAAALVLLSVCWQPSHVILAVLEGPAQWITRTLLLASLAGFLWGILALKDFDAFGVDGILSRARGQPPRAALLTIRGPYRWVRHPFYFSAILALWAAPVLSADRLLLNAFFTVWIAVGTKLEERDLVREFGQTYSEYQRQVPMLLPWRRPAPARRADGHFA